MSLGPCASVAPARIVEPINAARIVALVLILVSSLGFAFRSGWISNCRPDGPLVPASNGDQPSGDLDSRHLAWTCRWQVEPSGAVSQLVHVGHTGLVQHGQKEVGHRRALGIADMHSALEAGSSTSDDQNRQIGIEMEI